MSGRGRPTFMKRQKESARKRKQLDKTTRRAERTTERSEREPVETGGEDPDIAGIVPGPQPLPVEYGIVDEVTAASEEDEASIDDATADEEQSKG